MGIVNRFFRTGERSFFLFGPRGTGKSTRIQKRLSRMFFNFTLRRKRKNNDARNFMYPNQRFFTKVKAKYSDYPKFIIIHLLVGRDVRI